MGVCCYKNCEQEATTKGFVLARNPNGGQDIPTDVEACDKHKKVRGFFESEEK
ncbi:hypothetical protein [Bacillus sp. M6-12]|uniref:hypothetical protein n=1 Tax=Bacillus sp. M6-12 TaxID=2054166 RepID=UPI0015E15238|nr:hypothetical protein [Bacillus sp. M6-12]